MKRSKVYSADVQTGSYASVCPARYKLFAKHVRQSSDMHSSYLKLLSDTTVTRLLLCSNSVCKPFFTEIHLVCDRPTDGPTDGWMDGRTDGPPPSFRC